MTKLTRQEFEFEIAKAFASYCEEYVMEWFEYAQEVIANMLESESIEYGDDNYSWTVDDAIEEAYIDISYWEHG